MGLDKIYEFRVKKKENRAFFFYFGQGFRMDSAYFVNVNHIII